MTAIASTPRGHNVKPPPGPAEPPARTTPAELTDQQRGWLSEASRSDTNGWLHVTIKGSPAARGFQYGFLVADEYAESIRVYREMTYQDVGMTYDFFIERAAELHADKIPDELREEMEGVAAGLTAAGMPATFNDVLGVNDWMELTGYWWPKNSGRYTALAPTGGEGNHCSAFIATGSATVDGSIVVGHTSFADFWQGQFENVILDMTPDDGNRMVMQTAPGWIASMSDFWLTSAGLAITETTIGGYDGFKGYDETRVPEFVRARKASQYARDIDHWVETLNTDNNGGYANSWLIGDAKTGEIARYEEGLLYQSLSRTTDGYFWGDNTPLDPRIRNLECFGTGFSDVRTPNGAREVRWRQLLDQYNGGIDAEVGKRMLGDTFDTYLGYIHPSARTICAHSDVDPCHDSGLTPFTPFGSVDGKVVTSADISALSLWARSGRADGTEFDADAFLRQHPQWDWQRGYLKDRPQQPWTYIESGKHRRALTVRAFRCPNCGQAVAFEVQQCSTCAVTVGYHYPSRQMVCAPSQTLTVDGRGWFRCAHWERGCNWLTADDSESGRCYADSFVREGPAADDTEAMSELDSTLKALRRLIFELMDLGLPIQPYYADSHGLAFDLLSSKTLGRPVMTGHNNGVITIDLAESLELYRERLRIKLREPYRTMLGHFRHEVGHYYEMVLVQNTPLIDDARALFGDDRQDYQAALQRHYNGEAPANWQDDFISEYATAHPWEDFAETWAHYLHITGTLATIADSGLVVEADRVKWDLPANVDARESYADGTIEDIMADWLVLSGVLNRVNNSMGRDDLYPFTIHPHVVAKLGFIHRVVTTTATEYAAVKQN